MTATEAYFLRILRFRCFEQLMTMKRSEFIKVYQLTIVSARTWRKTPFIFIYEEILHYCSSLKKFKENFTWDALRDFFFSAPPVTIVPFSAAWSTMGYFLELLLSLEWL